MSARYGQYGQLGFAPPTRETGPYDPGGMGPLSFAVPAYAKGQRRRWWQGRGRWRREKAQRKSIRRTGLDGYGFDWPWAAKDDALAAAEEAKADAECSGFAAMHPLCIQRRVQQQSEEAGKEIGRTMYAQLWETLKIPLLVGGVGLVVYFAANKAVKARKRKQHAAG